MISEVSLIHRAIMVAGVVAVFPSDGSAQPAQNRASAHAGQEIVAREGDRVIIEDPARVQIVRRRQAAVRCIFNETNRVLIMLVDYSPRPGEMPDGGVDVSFRFSEVAGAWPLEHRWEAFTTVDEYILPAPSSLGGLGIATPQGLVQLLPAHGPSQMQPDPDASVVLSFRGVQTTAGRITPNSFDEAEQEELSRVGRDTMQFGIGAGGPNGVGAGGISSFSESWTSAATNAAPTSEPVRVGGTVRPPQKIRDVAPVYPDQARQARIQGVVIVEITIANDGTVTDARVLRSIPMLDEAALAAVRQWQYAPTLLNGAAVSVMMIVAVPFAL